MKRILLAVLPLVLLACASPTAPDDAAWSPVYDADWNAVVECWGVEPEKPRVIVRDDCRTDAKGQYFDAGNAVTGPSLVNGITEGDTVQVCPDLAALRHEFSHVVSLAARGTSGYNGEGKCWL